ncbi:uridine kinase [Fictibacillus halophilus]|uniref:Uridine kinase n=1 Tax=Fictibacillus halophilus TaxID=1610490 RepID=A0ABV2LMH0_9BACL|nr:phosphoribulokinase [Fictibacillus halophilus]
MENILQEVSNHIKGVKHPLIIGISGHGAAGKTTFASKLIHMIGQEKVNSINTDPYIVRSELRKCTTVDYVYHNKNHSYKMTAGHPLAHHIWSLERDIKMIRDRLNLYTIGTHLTESILVSSGKQITIVEGMSVAFCDPALFDLKIYLYTDGDTELSRRGVRDVSERGTNIDHLLHSHEERRIQYEVFMHPKHQHFDYVVKNSNEEYVLETGVWPFIS